MLERGPEDLGQPFLGVPEVIETPRRLLVLSARRESQVCRAATQDRFPGQRLVVPGAG